MSQMPDNMPDNIRNKFEGFPHEAAAALLRIRELILHVADEQGLLLEEALKWGQISYLTKIGSTLRIDWSAKSPTKYKLFFNCKTHLVETFKEIYGDMFNYETNRVIVFDLGAEIPTAEVKRIIAATLKYHQLKQLPLLGM